MLFVEIPLGHLPVIYQAKFCLNLVQEEKLVERYKFSNKPYALQMLRRFDYVSGGEIDSELRKLKSIRWIHPVQRRFFIFREPEPDNHQFYKTLA